MTIATPEEDAEIFADSCLKAEKAALKLIARAEQNSLGLTTKLEQRGFSAAVAKSVVSALKIRNLLDDRRYAELWIRSRLSMGKAQSPKWLLASLVKRGIDMDSSKKVLNGILDQEAEYALLLKYLEKLSLFNKKKPVQKRENFIKNQLKYEGFSKDALDRYFNK